MKRTDLYGLQVFLSIAEHGSLRAAAAAIGVNPPAISLQLKAFEESLGTALFTRSTRSVTLTDAGRDLLQDTRHMLGAIDGALQAAREAGPAQSGELRITLPYRAWQLTVAPKLAAFKTAYPGIVLNLSFQEGLTDIVTEGFHAGIRLGDHLQDDMIARRLTPAQPGAYIAAPSYLSEYGTPSRPADLLDHECIRYRQIRSGRMAVWRFLENGEETTVNVTGRLILDDLRAVVEAVEQGLGIGWSLRSGIEEELAQGALVEVLDAFVPKRPGFFLYYPKPLARLGVLRAFIDHFGTSQPAPQ